MPTPTRGRCPECNAILVNSASTPRRAYCPAQNPIHGFLVDAIPEAYLYCLREKSPLPQAIRTVGVYALTAWRIDSWPGIWKRVRDHHGHANEIEAWHDSPGYKVGFLDRSGISFFVPYVPMNVDSADRIDPSTGEPDE